jgi:hypothetical protein
MLDGNQTVQANVLRLERIIASAAGKRGKSIAGIYALVGPPGNLERIAVGLYEVVQFLWELPPAKARERKKPALFGMAPEGNHLCIYFDD